MNSAEQSEQGFPSKPRAASPAGRESVLHVLQAPAAPCPLLEYCLVEAAYSRSVDLVVDLRRGKRPTLLERAKIQRELRLAYEHIPVDWQETRALPLLIVHLLKRLIGGWPSVLPVRLLVVYDEEDGWWMEAVIERFRLGEEGLRVERITLEDGAEKRFCTPDGCSLSCQIQPFIQELSPQGWQPAVFLLHAE
ncbi:MAG TPA: hypothetical protein EYH30_02990 [Anaerolineales bacterium]|nr:hypothetical protein [Anaerolineae bacterium]HIQ01086.1 hypothetical protein [Anaerolineales bacterium]